MLFYHAYFPREFLRLSFRQKVRDRDPSTLDAPQDLKRNQKSQTAAGPGTPILNDLKNEDIYDRDRALPRELLGATSPSFPGVTTSPLWRSKKEGTSRDARFLKSFPQQEFEFFLQE
ncbi:hypothetical protein D3C87_1318760 [compost metagenome]